MSFACEEGGRNKVSEGGIGRRIIHTCQCYVCARSVVARYISSSLATLLTVIFTILIFSIFVDGIGI